MRKQIPAPIAILDAVEKRKMFCPFWELSNDPLVI
jgi:hypothetical protein